MTDSLSPADLKGKLDRCVKCGLCLPQCPTFRLSRSENRSPRGRLALIEAVSSGQLSADDPSMRSHLDTCLQCRRCERVCPSAVPYGEILDEARSELLEMRSAGWYQRVIEQPDRLRTLILASRLVPAWLSRPIPKLHRQHRLARALYAEAPPVRGIHPAAGRSRGRVGLFPGCATSAQQGGALRAALRLLTYAGFDVVISGQAACCGALAAHSGQRERADALREANRKAFAGQCDTIVSIASGCGTHIGADGGFGIEHHDIQALLLEQGRLTRESFLPRQQRVALHTPCTVENVYRGGDWAGLLLALIPKLEVIPVGEPGQCCGSAGDYLLRHPDTADALRLPVLEAVIDSGAPVLATSNVGCAIHFSAGLASMRHDVEVLHPIELLERQLIDASPSGYDYAISDASVVAS